MNPETEFIIQCNRNSFIEQVVYSKATIDINSLLHQPLLFCITPAYLEAGKRFVEDIRWIGKSENVVFEIVLNNEKLLFSFSGVFLNDHIIIVAQQTSAPPVHDLPIEEMVAEEIKQSISEAAESEQTPEEEKTTEVTVWDLMEEMSRLNNELINTKRELIQKNIELQRLQEQLKKGRSTD